MDTLEAIAHTLTAIDHNIEIGMQAIQAQNNALQNIARALAVIAQKR
jgi:hypothetical protein